jgi:hypothetical protein
MSVMVGPSNPTLALICSLCKKGHQLNFEEFNQLK